jgi:hypothetical protein
MENRRIPGRLSPLEEGALNERLRSLVDGLFGPNSLTPLEITELNTISAVLSVHEAGLSQPPRPRQVGEFRDMINGKVISVTFEGPGWVGMHYQGEDPKVDPSVVRRYRIDDFEGMRRMGSIVPIIS